MKEAGHLCASIVRALEALEDGDQLLVVEILVGAVETFPVCDPLGTRRHCAECGVGPLWPGELADHLDRVHAVEERPCAA